MIAYAHECAACHHLLSQHRFGRGEDHARCRHCDCSVTSDAPGLPITRAQAERDHQPELAALAAEAARY